MKKSLHPNLSIKSWSNKLNPYQPQIDPEVKLLNVLGFWPPVIKSDTSTIFPEYILLVVINLENFKANGRTVLEEMQNTVHFQELAQQGKLEPETGLQWIEVTSLGGERVRHRWRRWCNKQAKRLNNLTSEGIFSSGKERP